MSYILLNPKKDIIIKNTDGTIYTTFKEGENISIWGEREGKIWRRFSRMVKMRDNNTCQNCKKNKNKNPEIILHVHHIIPVKEKPQLFLDETNCITLCKNCHKEIHAK